MIYVITEDLLGYSTSGSLIRSSYGTSVVGGYCCAAKRKVEKRFLRIKNLVKTKRRYATILADPPWRFEVNKRETDSEVLLWDRKLPYVSMEAVDIEALPVGRLADKDAMLWLWSTGVHIHEALHVMKAWGFNYRTMRIWVKPRIGTGYWFRGQHEILLLGIRGRPSRGRKNHMSAIAGNNISTVFSAPTSKHSAKPPESYRDIERLSKPPRIELFARRARRGWDSWGDEAKEIDKELERDVRRYL